MTGVTSTSIQISYTTEDGIATEELVGGYGPPEFMAEVEDVEEYPLVSDIDIKEECVVKDSSKLLNGSIGFEFKMVTLITDKDSDRVRIIGPDEQDTVQTQILMTNNNVQESADFGPMEEEELSLQAQQPQAPTLEEELIKAAQDSLEADTNDENDIEVSENVEIGNDEDDEDESDVSEDVEYDEEFRNEVGENILNNAENGVGGENTGVNEKDLSENVVIGNHEENQQEVIESVVMEDNEECQNVVMENVENHKEIDSVQNDLDDSSLVIGIDEDEVVEEEVIENDEEYQNVQTELSDNAVIENIEHEEVVGEIMNEINEMPLDSVVAEARNPSNDPTNEEEEIMNEDEFNSLSPQLESTPQSFSPEVSNDNRDVETFAEGPYNCSPALYLSMAPYDGPPVLSPNYQTDTNPIEMGLTDLDGFTNQGRDEQPPALIQEYPSEPPLLSTFRPIMKRKRRGRKRKMKIVGNGLRLNGKSITKSSSLSPKEALHNKETLPVLIPHSSAEIQERVKNRQRKTTQTFGSSSSFDSSSEFGDPQPKPVPKTKPRKRKLSSESSSQNETNKKPKLKSGLFIVEKILKKGIINGRPYLYVKWLNYPKSKNTWEPEENFSLDLIAAYEKSLEEKGEVPIVEHVKLKLKRPRARPKSVQQQERIEPVVRRNSKLAKEKCPGCLSYPVTFTDNRVGINGFDQGLTYHKIFESFVLDEVRCALVEFDEKHCLELIPLTIINERLKAEIKLN